MRALSSARRSFSAAMRVLTRETCRREDPASVDPGDQRVSRGIGSDAHGGSELARLRGADELPGAAETAVGRGDGQIHPGPICLVLQTASAAPPGSAATRNA